MCWESVLASWCSVHKMVEKQMTSFYCHFSKFWIVCENNLQSVKNHETICTLHTVLHLLFLHFPHKAALILLMANMKKVLLIFQKSTDIPLLLQGGNKGSSTYIIAILTSLGGWCRSSQEKDSLGAVLWGHFVFNSLSPLVLHWEMARFLLPLERAR